MVQLERESGAAAKPSPPRSGERVASAAGASRVRGSSRSRNSFVTRGLDPRVDLLRKNFFANRMDCRVKPGNDDCDCCSHLTLTRLAAFAARHPLPAIRSEEHTSELQSLRHLVCRLLLEK